MNRYKQRMILAAATAALVPLTVACGSAAADSGPVTSYGQQSVTGVDWRVDSLTVGGRTLSAPGTARLRVDVAGRAVGNLGCNQFSAQATVRGDRITLGGLRTTRMACAPERMAFERALARVLTTGTLVARGGHRSLTLTDGNGDLVHLSRHAPG